MMLLIKPFHDGIRVWLVPVDPYESVVVYSALPSSLMICDHFSTATILEDTLVSPVPAELSF